MTGPSVDITVGMLFAKIGELQVRLDALQAENQALRKDLDGPEDSTT